MGVLGKKYKIGVVPTESALRGGGGFLQLTAEGTTCVCFRLFFLLIIPQLYNCSFNDFVKTALQDGAARL